MQRRSPFSRSKIMQLHLRRRNAVMKTEDATSVKIRVTLRNYGGGTLIQLRRAINNGEENRLAAPTAPKVLH